MIYLNSGIALVDDAVYSEVMRNAKGNFFKDMLANAQSLVDDAVNNATIPLNPRRMNHEREDCKDRAN